MSSVSPEMIKKYEGWFENGYNIFIDKSYELWLKNFIMIIFHLVSNNGYMHTVSFN